MAQGSNSRRDFRTIEGMDPAANWLLGPALDDYLPPETRGKALVAFLLALGDESAVRAFNELPPVEGVGFSNGAFVIVSGSDFARVEPNNLLPVLAPLAWFERLVGPDDPFREFRLAPKRIVLSTPTVPHGDLSFILASLGIAAPVDGFEAGGSEAGGSDDGGSGGARSEAADVAGGGSGGAWLEGADRSGGGGARTEGSDVGGGVGNACSEAAGADGSGGTLSEAAGSTGGGSGSDRSGDASDGGGAQAADRAGGTMVVIAVIDDGPAFAHERLRNAAGTRVACFWDMNPIFVPPHLTPLPPVLPVLPLPPAVLGELVRPNIDFLIATSKPGGAVDEDLIYRRAGLIDHSDPRHKSVAWRASHGAHVLDLAAGYDPATNEQNRPVIAVQLPTDAVARTTGELLDFYVWLAILYCLSRADAMAGSLNGLRLVINVSFGYLAGPHDGGGVLETFIDRVIQDRGGRTQIVLPTGNAQSSRCHARIAFDAANRVDLEWIVQPNDRTHSVIEIWLPTSAQPFADPFGRLRITLTQPDGRQSGILEAAGAQTPLLDRNNVVMGHMELVVRIDGRRMFRIAIHPTERPQPDPRPLAPAGCWRLTFRPGANALAGAAHAWVQRDDSLYGYPQSGRQSYFEHPDYVRFRPGGFEVEDDEDPAQATPCPVTRKSLLNAIASGRRAITAGGFRERTCQLAPYSAGGPNTPPEAVAPASKPDVLLPSDASNALPGVLAGGARSGGMVALNGTSVAAPQLARHVAELLGAGPADRPAVVAAAHASGVCPGAVLADRPDRGAPRMSRHDAQRSSR